MQWKDIEPSVLVAQKNVADGPKRAGQNVLFMTINLLVGAVFSVMKWVPDDYLIPVFIGSFSLVLLRMAFDGPFGVKCLACQKWLSYGRRGQTGPLEFLASEHRCVVCGYTYE